MAEEIVLSDRNVPRPPLQEELTRLYSQGFLTDITLSTEDGKNFEAHRVLLAARSHYFYSVVPRLKSDAVIFMKGVKGAHLDKILKFIYSGTCALSRHQLKPILEVAKSLQIKGLCDANPTDILQQQQPSALGASRFRNSESGQSAFSNTSPTSLTGGVSAALQRMQQQQQNRLSSSSSSSSPSSNAGGNLVDKTTSTTFKTPTGVARRSMTSAGSTSKSSGTSSSTTGGKQSQNSMLNGSPNNSDSDGEDSKTGKDDSDDDEKERASPTTSTRQSKRKRGRPPKGKHGGKSDQGSGNGKKTKDSGNGADPYDFDDDGNDPSGSAEEAATSGDEKQSESNKKNEWSGNLLQVNEAVTKSEMDFEEGQEGSDILSKDIIEKKQSKYATSSINGMQILPVKCQNQTAELHLPRFANGMRGQSIQYKDEWMTPGEFEMACGLTGKSKYLDNIQTDYGPLKTLTASGLLKPHSRKCRCSICRGEYESPEKLAKRMRQREFQEQGESSENGINMGDGINDLDRDDGDDGNFMMLNSPFQAKEEKDDSMLDDMLEHSTNSFDDSQYHNSMDLQGSNIISKMGDNDVGSAKRKKKKHKKDDWKKQLVNNQIVKAGANAALAHANAAAAAHAQVQAANMTVMNSSMTIASMNNGIISNEQQEQQHEQQQQQQSHQQIQSFMTDNGMSLGGTAVTYTYSANEVGMPPKISSPAILTNVNDPRIEPPQMQQPPTFYVMSPHPHATVATAPSTPHHNPFAGLTMPPAPPTPTPQIQMSPAPPQLMPHQLQQQTTQQQNVIAATNVVTKFSQDNASNYVQSSPSSTSSTGSTNIKTSASNNSTIMTGDKNGASDVNKFTGVKKLGAVMNVRCKSTTAILYSNKYETGSKGKCIQLGDEWLTPNEFEDRAGSKAKKYLSSIKCMGRPLRVYVNSGELKGTGPPPPPKAPRKPPQSHTNKTPTSIQAIAPHPPPGALTQLTYTMAPPTPTHISNAPSLPPNLNMMMGNQGPPILINQTSMAGTNLIGGSQPILTTPMTFTLAQPLEVRQNVSQAM